MALFAPVSAPAQELPVGTSALMIPAGAFSADGTDQGNYFNNGKRISTNATIQLHAAIYLPNTATITQVDMMTRDDDVGTITMYLKRNRFGVDGTHETLLTFTSPGNIGCTTNGLCHDMESLLDIKVDTANYIYWLDLRVPDDTGTGTDLEFYAVRILYDSDDVIFADTFESGDTGFWDGSTLKAGYLEQAIDLPDRNEARERILDSLSQVYIEDPLAQEALEYAVAQTKGYASPLVIPGPAFKTAGGTEYDDYYFSESYGFIYTRPQDNGGAVMYAPVDLPDGAEIQFFMALYVDSITDAGVAGYQDNIRFWMGRLSTVDIDPSLTMVNASTSGANDGIRALTVTRAQMEAVEAGCATVDTGAHYYWAGVDVGRYDTSPPAPYDDEDWWHKVYSIVILYTMP